MTVQTVYAIRLDVVGVDVFDHLVSLTEAWLTRDTPLSGMGVLTSGRDDRATLSVTTPWGTSERKIAWERAEPAGGPRALRIRRVEPHPGGSLHSTVTVGSSDERTGSLRLELALAPPEGTINPTELPTLRRPRLVGDVLGARGMVCSVRGQLVDQRFVPIGSADEAGMLADTLAQSDRLPLLLVNACRSDVWRLVERQVVNAAKQLAGLTRVAEFSRWEAASGFRALYPRSTPRLGEACLIWPDITLPQPQISLIDDSDPVSELMRIVSQAAAATYGRDQAWTAAVEAVRAEERIELARLLLEAEDRNDQTAIITALRGQLTAQTKAFKDTDEMAQYAIVENQQLSSDITLLRSQKSNLEWQLRSLLNRQDSDELTGATAVKYLREQMHKPEDLMDRLPEVTSGAIVFTDNARDSWTRTTYPNPDKMADWLCGLALAGLDWRDLNGQLGEPLQQWMSHSHGLEMSHLDDELQSRGLHLFRFDGREYDRTSHLQLDDHVSFDKVGRVYFAMDRDPYRIVVDHVGTKLYKPGRK